MFDIIFAEQVLEHVLWPSRAGAEPLGNAPHGVLVVNTPFLVRIHETPNDCARWTETGLRYLLAEGGFELDAIKTGSWEIARAFGQIFGAVGAIAPGIRSEMNRPFR